MKNNIITVLGGGIGLGEYNPGLIVKHQLDIKGISSDFLVYESFINAENQEKMQNTKLSFQKNFKLAQMAWKLAKFIRPNFDKLLINNLLKSWKKEKRSFFILFSGYWLPVLELYLSLCDYSVKIDLFYLGTTNKSWSMNNLTYNKYHHHYFSNYENKTIQYHIDISCEKIVPFHQRNNRYIIHGGGWSIGTYFDKISMLNKLNINLDIVVVDNSNITCKDIYNKYYIMDPEWHPWNKDTHGKNFFCPFGKIQEDGHILYKKKKSYPVVYDIIRSNKAIISKGGGATILDSLSSATPILLLEPYGEYERRNSILLEHLGLAIPLTKWVKSGCSSYMLDEIHCNLVAIKNNTKNFTEEYLHAYKNYI